VSPAPAGGAGVLSEDAVAFLVELERRFGARRRQLLGERAGRQVRWDAGERPGFLEQTSEVRSSDWTVAPLPAEVLDRRVEITGPVDRKMIINALHSGANVYMADFEDSTSPTWENVVAGQRNLMDAVRRELDFTDPATGKRYRFDTPGSPWPAVLMVRPRGWHLPEKHLVVDGMAMSASLFDFGLFFFHNAAALLAQGTRPYFYLPKMQSHLEARLWNDVFVFAQQRLGLAQGTARATVLIETLPAAFEMDEILFELREHILGLNCGRWDYIFSFIKTLRSDPQAVLPDRSLVTMTQPFLAAYSELLIRTCHRRGAHAMGGMAAQIPIKQVNPEDAERNAKAMAQVRADKLREVRAGHDGTWVAHPALVPIAAEIFNEHMPRPNQIERLREDVNVSASQLLSAPDGARTEAGLRHNIRVGVQYLAAWLRGQGCVPLYNLMEDAATAEICRTQLWQWLHHGVQVEGTPLTAQRVRLALDAEIEELVGKNAAAREPLRVARDLFEQVATGDNLAEFLTLPAYELLP